MLDDERRRCVDGRRRLERGTLCQSAVDELADRWRPSTTAGDDPGDEMLDLAQPGGTPSGTVAPRWLCHLLGLRHRCAHILLDFTSPDGRNLLVLQFRSWSKNSYPGFLDISVGGHVPTNVPAYAAALDEMRQELGLRLRHLEDAALTRVTGFESCTVNVGDSWYDREWCELFTGTVSTAGLEAVRFLDGEVAGVQLVPVAAAVSLVAQRRWPVAPGLAHSLHHCLPLA